LLVLDAGDHHDQNMQAIKEAFLSRARTSQTDYYLKSTRTPPLSRYEIKAGWKIPAILEQALNSDLPGELEALVSSKRARATPFEQAVRALGSIPRAAARCPGTRS
jgi:type IV secretory pathway VirB10-like protein